MKEIKFLKNNEKTKCKYTNKRKLKKQEKITMLNLIPLNTLF